MEFVKAKKHRYRSYLLKFWKREVGSLLLPFELEMINEYSTVRVNDRITISGYVKWISSRIFALLPTLFSNQIYLPCFNYTDYRPKENSYITASGTVKRIKIRRALWVPKSSRIFEAEKVLYVYDWLDSKPDIRIPKMHFDYSDFKRDLTYRISGLEPQQMDFLSFTALSTPSFYEYVGGVNLTLYDSTTSGLPNKVLRELKRVIPSDIGQLCTVRTPFGSFGLRYKYIYVSGDADKPLSKRNENFLINRTLRKITAFDELSLSLYSAQKRPRTIEDSPCSLSDIPTVVPENVVIDTTKGRDPEFDSFKYLMIQQMKTPVLEDYNSSLINIVNELEKLRESFGLGSEQLTKYGFLNANYYARPLSVLRKSLAYARAQNIGTVKVPDVSRIFEDYFKWNLDYVYEIWEDLLKPGKKIPLYIPIEHRKIIRIIRKYQETGKPGASREDIIAEAEFSSSKTEELIDDLLNKGQIYEPMLGFYRLPYG